VETVSGLLTTVEQRINNISMNFAGYYVLSKFDGKPKMLSELLMTV